MIERLMTPSHFYPPKFDEKGFDEKGRWICETGEQPNAVLTQTSVFDQPLTTRAVAIAALFLTYVFYCPIAGWQSSG